MKKIILTTAIISVFLISCKDANHKNEKTKTTEATESVQKHDTHSMDNTWVKEIKLDNGRKWRANRETNDGVEKMLSVLETTNIKTAKDYHNLASKLNEVKNYVVKECTMKGPSHDNLHVFLHPLIEKIEALGKVSTMDEGSKITRSIRENLKEYYNYFE